jgi:hypothetical protein
MRERPPIVVAHMKRVSVPSSCRTRTTGDRLTHQRLSKRNFVIVELILLSRPLPPARNNA